MHFVRRSTALWKVPVQRFSMASSGVELQLMLRGPDVEGVPNAGVTNETAEGGVGTGAPLHFLLGQRPDFLALDGERSAWFRSQRSQAPGTHTLRLYLRRDGGPRRANVAAEPNSVDLGDAVDGQVIELGVDPEELARALAEISR